MQISPTGIAIIKRWEGLVLETYDDGVGILTVGYGHTGRFRGHPTVAEAVQANGGQPITITEEEAEELLREDLREFENGVNRLIKSPTAQSMFDAFVSLSFNIGLGAFKKSTTLREHNNERYLEAADALTWFNKAGGQVWEGLVRRRAHERDHYLSGLDEVMESSPTPVAEPVTENSPRRNNPITTRTTTGATTAGAAGAAGASTVLMDDDEEQAGDETSDSADTDATETNTPEDITEDTTPDTGPVPEPEDDAEEEPVAEDDTEEDSIPSEETTTGTEVPADGGMPSFSDDEVKDAIVVLSGAIAILAALWVIFARIDDWRNYRR